jgi:hypothetical protein
MKICNGEIRIGHYILYDKISTVYGTGASIWSETNFGPIAPPITLKVAPFRAYAPFPALLLFLKCILEVVFCEGVQHRPRFCLDHHICVKMAAFQFYLQLGKQRKVGWVGDESHIVFGQIFPGEKGSVTWCVVVLQ